MQTPSRAFSWCLVASWLVVASLQAELPPNVYQHLKDRSPESLKIEVISVKVNGSAVEVGAKVISVQWSSSKLKSGDTIRIRYAHQADNQVPGPSEPILVKQGHFYQAYLETESTVGSYQLAARGHSFEAPLAGIAQWCGSYEGEAAPSAFTITSRQKWVDFWGGGRWEQLKRPMPQDLDETKEMAVLICLGERPTGGYRPEVVSAMERDGKCVVIYKQGAPSPDMIVTQALTRPWVVAIVPRSNLPLEAKLAE